LQFPARLPFVIDIQLKEELMFANNWGAMTDDEKLNWLQQEGQSTRQMVHAMSGEIAALIQKLEKRIADLEANKK
jgi:hypothetical protein